MTFAQVVNAEDEVIVINGYNFVKADKATITIMTDESQNVINLYYAKRNDLKYTVRFKELDTENTIHEDVIKQNATYKQTITSADEAIDIDGYTFDSADKDSITIDTTGNVSEFN